MSADKNRNIAGQAVLISSIILICLLLIINITSAAFNPVILLAQIIPLSLTLPGQLKGNTRAVQWLCFVDLFFLVQGILLCFTPGRLLFGLAETLICLILFFSAIIFIRLSRTAS